MYQAWESFKSMLRNFPYYYYTNEVLVHTFIQGLEPYAKIFLDSTVSGQILEKTYDELYMLMNCTSLKNPKWNADVSRRTPKKFAGLLEVDKLTVITT